MRYLLESTVRYTMYMYHIKCTYIYNIPCTMYILTYTVRKRCTLGYLKGGISCPPNVIHVCGSLRVKRVIRPH